MVASVLTQHNDNKRSGANLKETTLNTSNVNVNQFGLVASRQVTGQIYGQPLYVPAVNNAGGRNLVIVATMENFVYAFDADDVSQNANPVWQRQVDPHPVAANLFNQSGGRQYRDVDGNIGILSTPVIEPATNTLYVVAASCDPALLNGPNIQQAFEHLLFALDVGTGALKPAAAGSSNPVAITGQAAGLGYHDATAGEINDGVNVQKDATGAHVTMHVNGKDVVVADSANSQVRFNPMQQMNRPGLLLDNGLLYIAFGSHGDFDPYHGWVFAYDAATLKQRGIFCTTPGCAKAGIWQAGEGLVADGAGNVYGGTGNGDTKSNAIGGPDLGESYFRLRAGPSSLTINGFVSPFKDAPHTDEDLGAASPTVMSDGFLVGGGKDGNFYLLDPAKINNPGTAAAVVQQFMATKGPGSRDPKTFHIHGSPVVYDSPEHGVMVYVWGENDVLRAYHYDPATHSFPSQPNQRNAQSMPLAQGVLYASNDVKDRAGMPGGMLSLSAHGKTPGSAVLWASIPPFANANNATVRGELVAYAASQLDSQNRLVQLWRSHQNPAVDENPDAATRFAKFCCPTVADGKVFLATFGNTLRIYGLRQTPDGGYNVGFGGKTGLTLNGSARAADNARLRLAGQHLLQAGSVFSTAAVGIGKFTCTFRMRMWTDTPGAQTADGLTFCIQNEGPHALGGAGGGLGYGPDVLDPNDPGFLVKRSVAVKFDLIDDNIQPRSLVGLYQGGATPNTANAIGGEVAVDQTLNFHSGHQFDVQLDYDGAALTVRLRDADAAAHPQVVHTFPVNIPAIVGGPNAHVGFTAATGGLSANLDVLSWQFTIL